MLLLWWLAQQLQQLNPDASNQISANDIVASTESGSLFNTIVIIIFAALGATHLYRGRQLLHDARVRTVLSLLCLYLGWALLSALWSVDQTLTIKRYVALVLVVLGSVGLGLGFYGGSPTAQRALAIHTVVAGTVSAAILWISAVWYGNIDLLNPAWAAKNFGIGTPVLYPISFAIISLTWLNARVSRRKLLLLLLVVINVVSLIAIKGRFISAFTLTIASIQPLFEMRSDWKKLLPYLCLTCLAGYALLTVAALGGEPALRSITDTLWTYGTLETGGSDVTNLTGRTPLWAELVRYFAERPWTGYGFGAFWNPQFMPTIWAVIGWNAPTGHNGYLDEAVATGVVGLGLMLALWLTGLLLALSRRFRRQDPFAVWVISTMSLFLLYNLGDSLMQNYFRFPFYVSLTGLLALLATQARERASRA